MAGEEAGLVAVKTGWAFKVKVIVAVAVSVAAMTAVAVGLGVALSPSSPGATPKQGTASVTTTAGSTDTFSTAPEQTSTQVTQTSHKPSESPPATSAVSDDATSDPGGSTMTSGSGSSTGYSFGSTENVTLENSYVSNNPTGNYSDVTTKSVDEITAVASVSSSSISGSTGDDVTERNDETSTGVTPGSPGYISLSTLLTATTVSDVTTERDDVAVRVTDGETTSIFGNTGVTSDARTDVTGNFLTSSVTQDTEVTQKMTGSTAENTDLVTGTEFDTATMSVVAGSTVNTQSHVTSSDEAKSDPTTTNSPASDSSSSVTVSTTPDTPVCEQGYNLTVVFMYAPLSSGQKLFIRGGGVSDNDLSIAHLSPGQQFGDYNLYATGDRKFGWSGGEPYQPLDAEGSPSALTSNDPLHPLYHPFNRFGADFWLTSLCMDCRGTDNGWFFLRSFVQGSPDSGLEWDRSQVETCEGNAPLRAAPNSSHHAALCGKLNVFRRNEDWCRIDSL